MHSIRNFKQRKIEIKKNISICIWILGRQGKLVLTFGAILQFFISWLDVVFLALISPFILLLASPNQKNPKISLLGMVELNANQILLLILFITSIKSLLSLIVQKFIYRKLSIREAEVTSAFVRSSLLERMDQAKLKHSVDLSQIVNNTFSTIFTTVFRPAVGFFGDFATFLTVMLALSIYRPAIAIVSIFYFLTIGYIIFRILGRRQQELGADSLKFDRAALRTFGEIKLIGIHLKLSNREEPVLRSFFQHKLRFARSRANSYFLLVVPRFILEFFLVSGLCFVFYANTIFGESSSMLPTLALLTAAGYRILPSINSIIVNISNFRNSGPALNRVDEIGKRFNIRDSQLTFEEDLSRMVDGPFEGDLVFENVSYRYIDSPRDVFVNFNARISEKSSTLIDGVNGSGKTTLIFLALGLLRPDMGRVFMEKSGNKIEIKNGISGLRYVSQDVGFLDESIGHNIALRPITDSDMPRLVDVCSKVGILQRILSNAEGFNLHVGENGGKLSAGERQRIGIARALFDSPSFLLFDEPTANLDPIAEGEVWRALQNIKGEVTMVIVSHRKVPDDLFDKKITLSIYNSSNAKKLEQ